MAWKLQLHSTHKTFLLLVLFPLFISFCSLSIHSQPIKAHTFIYASCSQENYQQNSPLETNLNSFLASVVSSSSQELYNSFAIGNETSTQPEGTIYGLFQCRGDLKTLDCSKCTESAVNQIRLICPYSFGASLQLDGCYIRYEHIDFLGKLDTSLRYNKCSESVNSDVEFFRRRDDVLADLQSAISFKVSSSGLVGGFAQCLGDLSQSDCSACLVDAVSKLKSICGSAASADVFLAQCYARYWSSGYYDLSNDSNEDDVGRTVAIVVGVIAGVAVLIVLLSFCRIAMR